MNRFSNIAAIVAGVAFSAGLCLADDDGDTLRFKLKPSGFASIYMGEIVKGGVNSKTGLPMNGTWMKQMITNVTVNASLGAKNSLDIGMEMEMYNDFPISNQETYGFRYQYFYPYLSEAEYTHLFGDVGSPYLTLTAGYFPFKYNPDARNLGEYLFRTGTYPQYIDNSFDFPLARLMGLHAALNPLPNLTIDGLFYSNMQLYAVGDWNLAAIATYTPFKGIEIGLGGSLNSILSADSANTTPHNQYGTAYHITYNEATGVSDTSFYTFRGIKVMARASIDLKKIIGVNGFGKGCQFGKEDLKLFGETAILGLKNYPENLLGGINYDTLSNRMPVMVGLNLPVCKLLDVLSLQAEWFGNPYPNDIGEMFEYGAPLPGPLSYIGQGVADPADPTGAGSHWRWSIYGTRNFARYYSISFQVASDHIRPLAINEENTDFNEICHNINQWYYMLKLTAGF